jgi:hypothetical protein
MAVNSHMVGRGRNCSEPIARLRYPGGSGHSVAHPLCGLGDVLWLCRECNVLARVSKCRCAKRERKHDGRASDRPAAQATWSAYCFHALSVMPLRISCKLIYRRFKTKIRRCEPHGNLSPSKGNVPDEGWSDALLLLRSGCLPLQRVSHKWQRQIPTSNLPPISAQR